MSFEHLPKFGSRATGVRPGIAVVGSGFMLRISFIDLRSVGIGTEAGSKCIVKIGAGDDNGCIALCRCGNSVEDNNQSRALMAKASRHSSMYIQSILTHMDFYEGDMLGSYPTKAVDGRLVVDFNNPIELKKNKKLEPDTNRKRSDRGAKTRMRARLEKEGSEHKEVSF